jgi:hypothetical protein
MNNYDLQLGDFIKVTEFGVRYYLDPAKNTTGRTTGEPRGLGAILDAFSLGKLTELGVKNILNDYNKSKDYGLDFTIRSNSDVAEDPDIIEVIENSKPRNPMVFLEIKNTSEGDRWIGLTDEQFTSIKTGANGRDVYTIYASITSTIKNANPKTTDLTGMLLKGIYKKSSVFSGFADLNGVCAIEFVISSKDLAKYSYNFKKGMNFYETALFKEKIATPTNHPIKKKDKTFRNQTLLIKEYKSYNSTIEIEKRDGEKAENKDISMFKIQGSFKLYKVRKRTIIECNSNIKLNNEIFGTYELQKGRYYYFNLETVGRDPILKRNNYFMAKRRIFQLIKQGKIDKPDDCLKKITKKI